MFLVCGEALWDLFPEDGPDGLALRACLGGSPFNVAVGLARLGTEVGLVTGLPGGAMGQRVRTALSAERVETRYLVETDRPGPLAMVDLGPDGVPHYTFYTEGTAERALTPADMPDPGPEVWGIHAGSYALVAEPVGLATLDLIERCKAGRLITLDPNVRLGVEPDVEAWRHRIAAHARLADLIKVSDEDLGLLYPGADPAAVAADWRGAGAGVVVITRGAGGAEAYGPAGPVSLPGLRVALADTVGAGDSFQAALIAGLDARGVRDRAGLDALQADALGGLLGEATRAAALTCTRTGADLPTRAEIAAFSPN